MSENEPSEMSENDKSCWERLFQSKGRGEWLMAHATLTRPVVFSEFKGHNEPTVDYEKPEGTRVLVTMVSRFGDAGIRFRDQDRGNGGYDARVQLTSLKDLETVTLPEIF